jgi:hypothetical protein
VGGGFEGQGGLPIDVFELSRPAIFPIHLGGTDDPAISTWIMHDLATAGDGFYQYATSQAAIERAFDRMATWLRRPAPYSLTYETSAVDYPPATVAVLPPPSGTPVVAGSGVAVEIILDTSGSMLDKVGKKRRIDIAKAVLTDLVERRLPAGVPFALRVFGDARDVCGTRVAVPLAPLDADAVTRLVKRIGVVRAADTPIGAAIAAVASDLAGDARTRIVLLITDAEEVWPHPDLCGRDPADAIEALVAQGIEMRLNIVGFGLSGKKSKAQMRAWAELGGGDYFDAGDANQLSARIADALRAPFRVLDARGRVVANGVVGDTVTLPPGTYRVEVLSQPPVVFEDVLVEPSGAVQLTIAEE